MKVMCNPFAEGDGEELGEVIHAGVDGG